MKKTKVSIKLQVKMKKIIIIKKKTHICRCWMRTILQCNSPSRDQNNAKI